MERIAVHHEGESPSIIPRLPVHIRETEHSPEKIGMDLMFQGPPTEVRARMNPFDSHLSHCRPDTVSPHGYPLFFKQGGNPTAPIIGVGGVDLVNSVPKLNLFRRRSHRLVVQDRSGHPAETRLDHHREIRILGRKPALALGMAQLIPDFFFNQVIWVESRPISW